MSPLGKYLVGVSVPYVMRVLLYYGAFKIRGIACSKIGYWVIGGGFILAGLFGAVPILYYLLALGVPVVMMNKYTDAGPADTFVIVFIVELIAYLSMDLVIGPLVF